jgi:hypothetical protein
VDIEGLKLLPFGLWAKLGDEFSGGWRVLAKKAHENTKAVIDYN